MKANCLAGIILLANGCSQSGLSQSGHISLGVDQPKSTEFRERAKAFKAVPELEGIRVSLKTKKGGIFNDVSVENQGRRSVVVYVGAEIDASGCTVPIFVGWGLKPIKGTLYVALASATQARRDQYIDLVPGRDRELFFPGDDDGDIHAEPIEVIRVEPAVVVTDMDGHWINHRQLPPVYTSGGRMHEHELVPRSPAVDRDALLLRLQMGSHARSSVELATEYLLVQQTWHEKKGWVPNRVMIHPVLLARSDRRLVVAYGPPVELSMEIEKPVRASEMELRLPTDD